MLSTAANKNLPVQEYVYSISEALANLRVGIQNADKDRNERWWLKTGLADFDEAFQGLRLGAVTVLASRPSMGRSAFALNIATNVGIHQKIRAIVPLIHRACNESASSMKSLPCKGALLKPAPNRRLFETRFLRGLMMGVAPHQSLKIRVFPWY